MIFFFFFGGLKIGESVVKISMGLKRRFLCTLNNEAKISMFMLLISLSTLLKHLLECEGENHPISNDIYK